MKHLFIINPAAGNGKGLQLIPGIEKNFAGQNEEYCIEITKYPGQAVEIVKQHLAKGKTRVYAVGGDGTLNEVVNGMVNCGGRNSLAVIPAGSGNDFIKSLVHKMTIDDILSASIKGREKPIDIGRINDRYFINISAVGFDAQVTYNAGRLKRIPFIPKGLIYLAGVGVTLLKYENRRLVLSIDNRQVIETDALLVTIANGRYYGGGMLPAPQAVLDDGRLDVCLVTHRNAVEIVKFFPKYVKGRYQEIEGVHVYKGTRITIDCGREMPVLVDGEVYQFKDIRVEVIPGAINIVIPE